MYRLHSGFVTTVSPSLTTTSFFVSQKCTAKGSRRSDEAVTLRPRRARLFPTAELTENESAKEAGVRMEKTIESVQLSFNTIRTGRATPALLDRVMVSYYDVDTPLNQLASVSVNGTSTIVVEPYDKSVVADVERALMESDLGMAPNSDGSTIRLSVPQLTQDRRVELVKQVKVLAEDGRVALRNIRRDGVDALKKMEKKKELGKDESMDMQNEVQKLTDKFVKQVDALYKSKEADIMKV